MSHFFAILDRKRANNLLKKADIYQNYDLKGAKLSSIYKIALMIEKNWKRSAFKVQQILKTLVRNSTSAIAVVALYAFNCALPTSGIDYQWTMAVMILLIT